MSKFWKIGTPQDTLGYYVAAIDRQSAIKVVEALTGPQNPSVIRVAELPDKPAGYKLSGQIPCFLEEDPDYDG